MAKKPMNLETKYHKTNTSSRLGANHVRIASSILSRDVGEGIEWLDSHTRDVGVNAGSTSDIEAADWDSQS